MIYCYDLSENTVTSTTYAKLEIENFEECVFFLFLFLLFFYIEQELLSPQGQDSFFLKDNMKRKNGDILITATNSPLNNYTNCYVTYAQSMFTLII